MRGSQAIDRLAPWGGTALYDVTIRALDLLGRQTGRRSIVLFTDGDDQSSHATLDAAIARTEGSDATIYAIGQGRAVKRPSAAEPAAAARHASAAAARSSPSDELKLDEVFEEILEDLRNQYRHLLPGPGQPARRRLAPHPRGGAGRKYHVRARQGYRFARN